MYRVFALLMLFAMTSFAADPTPKAFPYEYDQHDFDNGLRLITVPTSYPNLVSLYIVVQAGSRNEVEPGRSGFAHLFEHMMFRGTKRFPPEKWEATMQKIGADTNAYTTDDHTAYHATFSAEDLETVLDLEADRFQNLEYQESVFRTEALAVLGEYNKNSAAPTSKLFEVLRNTAFDRHTYKHTTMGFLEDIKNMPNLYDYSLQFFDRYYRPEYTTIIVAGDVQPPQVRELVGKYWAGWKRGNYRAEIPAESAPASPRDGKVPWATPTLPWVVVSYRGPAYSDAEKDYAAMDVIAYLGFAESSDLYQKLVIQEQRVDTLYGMNAARIDPYLVVAGSRVKNAADIAYIREAVLNTFSQFKDQLVPATRLEAVKSHLRYDFALRMDNSEAIAASLARAVALRRTPETINRLYEVYGAVTPADVRDVARKYFTEGGRTIVTLQTEQAQ